MKRYTDTDHAIVKYYQLLGGHSENFPEETVNRVLNFRTELQHKRGYGKFTTFKSDLDEMIIVNGIKIFSFCEHHLLPFFGFCSIGYIPKGKILGLSKFQRLVDMVASKPTLQERITHQLVEEMVKLVKPKGVGVAMTCVHTCMYGRGINTSTCEVNTQALGGVIKEHNTSKTEFLHRIKIENILR